MHGVREELLQAQARALNLPLHKIYLPRDCNMEDYNTLLLHEMNTLKQQGATTCAFGDIFLEDLKAFREKQMQQAQLQSSFPIWKQADTTTLAKNDHRCRYQSRPRLYQW
ncbi:hypothetical protein [Rubritalea tangerina]|uniref:Dph6-related ATP pyrophosphatase n=1 Tax=Rubritalea tangerina TaxID=430798 RepID=UPI0036202E3E